MNITAQTRKENKERKKKQVGGENKACQKKGRGGG